jgi:uncharacterized OB-fold protein
MIEPTPETAPFWAALADGRLTARRCTECGTLQPTPRAICRCGSDKGEWVDLPADAELVSHTTIGFAPPGREYLRVPYTLGIVRYPALGHQLMALIDVSAGDPVIGATVRLSPYRNGAVVLPQFQTIKESGDA